MNLSEFVVYFWMFPVVLQILIPLLFGIAWIVIILPVSLLTREVRAYFRKHDPQIAR